MMKHLVLLGAALMAASSAFAQDYKLEPIATGAPGLPENYSSLIDGKGYRVVGPKGPWCEIWFRKSLATEGKPSDPAISFAIAQGTLIAVMRFPGEGADRRGQTIKAGLYTLRYSDFPVDGAHQGVAPQRDFALLTPLAGDADPTSAPGFEALVKMSAKASGTPHPAVLSIETPAGSTFPEITKENEHDWVLNVKVGDLPFALIVAGKTEG